MQRRRMTAKKQPELRIGRTLKRLVVGLGVTLIGLPVLGIIALMVVDYAVYYDIRALLSRGATPSRMEVSGYQRSLVVTDEVVLLGLATAAKAARCTGGGEAFDTIGVTYKCVLDFGSGATYPISFLVHADGGGFVIIVPRGPGWKALAIFSDPDYYDVRFENEVDKKTATMLAFLIDADTPGRLVLQEDE